MRYAIIADIHANLEAFTAVLEDIQARGGVDEFWCLGDIVGYGPDPHRCLEMLRSLRHACVAGNHDWAAIGKINTADFNPDAAAACRWTAPQLTAADTAYLGNLPATLTIGDFTLVHGSPREPIWEYIISTGIAKINFAVFPSRFCLVGHSHVPAVFREEADLAYRTPLSPNIKLVLGRHRLIINPGAVGQPRDGTPEASYAIYDSEPRTVCLRRLPYDIEATQAKMLQAGLPVRLASRLSSGA